MFHNRTWEGELAVNSFVKEFREFINRGNLLDLAIGIVLGTAFAAVVKSFVDNVLMALIAAIVGKPSFNDVSIHWGQKLGFDATRGSQLYKHQIFIGSFITDVISFLIIAFSVFLIVKGVNRYLRKPHEEEPAITEKDVLVEIRDLLASDRRG